ncbi:hypothetical protein HYH03_014414 [Edaphochlamys debaryana]|uniref:GATA-type domain-containing protein n=1 Tax=Edaphochlamys debaryana TaxID=47281 RepID=A0A835XNU6_9CHLO|nr:hypothetical protein HYH03_014414 [Edaphochlamys debaryana]|eukprot:KAG2486915.1 hypothetical protein HYH03_014414 [Edaphochlamys debaryana]
MRGLKRKATSTPAAVTPATMDDALLDAANRRGIRCCVECGATSTPQWREGPAGPKTLCNACGVRRQRLLRKQQAQSVGASPTAPVAAVQARRRTTPRRAAQAPPPLAEDFTFAAPGSPSEQSSDEAEPNWALAAKQPAAAAAQLQRRETDDGAGSAACNEEESAAYDLLFFASGAVSADDAEALSDFALDAAHRTHAAPQHGHNTRRHVVPAQRRNEDFLYYEEGAGVGAGVGVGAGTGAVPSGLAGGYTHTIKRRRVVVAPPVHRVRVIHHLPPRPSASSCSDEGSADSRPRASTPTASPAPAAVASIFASSRPAPAVSDISPSLASVPAAEPHPSGLQPQHSVAEQPAPPAVPAPAAAAATAAPPALPAALAPLAPLLTLSPSALPVSVLPLSLTAPLPLPGISAADMAAIVALHAEFQAACLKLQQANAAVEAVSAVAAEQAQAAEAARGAAVEASQQLADGARAVAEMAGL